VRPCTKVVLRVEWTPLCRRKASNACGFTQVR
jgi:hypothetical protein